MISRIDKVDRRGPLYAIHWTDSHGKRGTTMGSASSAHVRALLSRAKREGVYASSAARDPRRARDPKGRIPASRYLKHGPSFARYKKPSAKVLHDLKIARVVHERGRNWLVEFTDGMGVHVFQHETIPWYFARPVHDRARYYEEARPEPPQTLAHAYQYKALTRIVPHQASFFLYPRTGRYSDTSRSDLLADVDELLGLTPEAFYRPDERRDRSQGRRRLRPIAKRPGPRRRRRPKLRSKRAR